ncbi:MAG: hypothetical protein IJX17_03490, partial [Clostridia bacterium]|nr:hypothetical protein [Clostridia bacterium]
IPSKAGYTGEWESYEIKAEDLEINAIYTPIIYTARFVIGGETYETRTFTIEDSEISNIPSVPSKAGYTGEWESYEIKAENLVIKAELIIYTASFVADDVVVDTRTFTVEDSEISNMPSVPEKDDLVGTWEKYTLKAEDIVINAVYKEEFIKIKTKEELLDFVSNENNYRKNVILDADIDLEGMEWKPILFYNETKYQYGYWGIFDGNGHTISNYKINKKITSADDIDYYSIYSGFFGFIYDASICNLNLSNYVVEITFDVDEQILDGVDGLVGYYGGLVGGCSNSEITNCSVSGDIIIKDTYNKGNLTITGGLIGAAGNCIIDNCHSSGNIITSSCVVGGLVGGYDGLISNSYSTVNIKCQNCIFICAVGGLVASSTSLIMTDCYFAGDIELILDSDLDVFVGGLVAMLESSTITNCYVSGTVQVNSENYLQLESLYTYFYIGGFAGYIGDTVTIKNCYREGNLDVTLTVFSDGNYAYGYIGNFIGYVESNLNIENSYSAGDVNVNVTGDGDTGITFYIGGLIGYISEITDYEKYTKITNCYSSTNITGVMNSSTSYDSIVTGGLVAGANSSIITNCYASGNISATNKINENVVISCYAGGLFGYKNGVIIENCYRYNGQKISATIEYSRETRNGDICTEGTNRSMQVIWTFILENWDSEVWNLYSDKNPTLKIA